MNEPLIGGVIVLAVLAYAIYYAVKKNKRDSQTPTTGSGGGGGGRGTGGKQVEK